MNNSHEVRFWAIQAFIGGIVLALAVAVIFSALSGIIDLRKEWATLLTGLLTTLATVGTVGAVYAQIVHARERELDNEIRENLAARAALNAPLSNLIEYEKLCLDRLLSVSLPIAAGAVPKQLFSPPPYPEQDVSFMIDCIKTADGESAEQLSSIVSKLQIQTSRLSGLKESLSVRAHPKKNR